MSVQWVLLEISWRSWSLNCISLEFYDAKRSATILAFANFPGFCKLCLTRWWFQRFVHFHARTLEKWYPIWRTYFFQMGDGLVQLFNHPTSLCLTWSLNRPTYVSKEHKVQRVEFQPLDPCILKRWIWVPHQTLAVCMTSVHQQTMPLNAPHFVFLPIYCWWFRNPAANQLKLVPVYVFIPLFTGFLYIPGGDHRISEPSSIINVWYIFITKHTWIRHGLLGTSSPESKWMGSKFLGLMGWSTENPRGLWSGIKAIKAFFDQGFLTVGVP